MRDAVGMVLLVQGCMAVSAGIALAASRPVAPDLTAAAGVSSSPRRMPMVFIVAASLTLAVAAVLLVPPHFTVTLALPDQVVAAPGSHAVAVVHNHGLLDGRWEEIIVLDGRRTGTASAQTDGGRSSLVRIPLPDGLASGSHELAVGDARLRLNALTPPGFATGALLVYPKVGALGQPVHVSLPVTNRGEAGGVFRGVLRVDGERLEARKLELDGGKRGILSFRFIPRGIGRCRVSVSGARAGLLIVKPERPRSGTVLARSGTGLGRLLVQNRTADDLVLELCRNTRSGAKPGVAVYVRAGHECEVTGISDGSHYIYYARGRAWNHTTDGFLSDCRRFRFKNPASFTTSSWTTHSTDWDTWTAVTTRHTRYTRWRVAIRPDWVLGPRGGVIDVEEADFPSF